MKLRLFEAKDTKKPSVKTEGYKLVSGDEGDRTPDLGVANAALSHLSYIPTRDCFHIKLTKNGQSKIYSDNTE